VLAASQRGAADVARLIEGIVANLDAMVAPPGDEEPVVAELPADPEEIVV